MLFESDRPNLTVYHKDVIVAQFADGKFETDDDKIIKILQKLDTVSEVDLSKATTVEKVEDLKDEDYFDGQKFKKKAENTEVVG